MIDDLPPPRKEQEDSITLEPGLNFICSEQVGHWYSPAFVLRKITEARKDERTPWADDCYRLESKLNNIARIVAEMRSKHDDVTGYWTQAEEVGNFIADLEAALVAKENK